MSDHGLVGRTVIAAILLLASTPSALAQSPPPPGPYAYPPQPPPVYQPPPPPVYQQPYYAPPPTYYPPPNYAPRPYGYVPPPPRRSGRDYALSATVLRGVGVPVLVIGVFGLMGGIATTAVGGALSRSSSNNNSNIDGPEVILIGLGVLAAGISHLVAGAILLRIAKTYAVTATYSAVPSLRPSIALVPYRDGAGLHASLQF